MIIYVNDFIGYQTSPLYSMDSAIKMVSDNPDRHFHKHGYFFYPITSHQVSVMDLKEKQFSNIDFKDSSFITREFKINSSGIIMVESAIRSDEEEKFAFSIEQCPRGENVKYVVGDNFTDRDIVCGMLANFKTIPILQKNLDKVVIGSGKPWIFKSVKDIVKINQENQDKENIKNSKVLAKIKKFMAENKDLTDELE